MSIAQSGVLLTKTGGWRLPHSLDSQPVDGRAGPATGRSDLPWRILHPQVRCSFVTHVLPILAVRASWRGRTGCSVGTPPRDNGPCKSDHHSRRIAIILRPGARPQGPRHTDGASASATVERLLWPARRRKCGCGQEREDEQGTLRASQRSLLADCGYKPRSGHGDRPRGGPPSAGGASITVLMLLQSPVRGQPMGAAQAMHWREVSDETLVATSPPPQLALPPPAPSPTSEPSPRPPW